MFQFQSPRQDVVDSIRNAIKLDYENSLKLEQGKWERQLQQLKEEHEQTLVIIFFMSAFSQLYIPTYMPEQKLSESQLF